MADSVKVAVTCGNPECGKLFKFTKPEKPGKYGIDCPYCQTKNVFEVQAEQSKPEDTVDTGLQQDGSYRLECQNNSCRFVFNVPAALVRPNNNIVSCPKCNAFNTFYVEPTEADLLRCQTHDCSGQLTFTPNHGDGVFATECSICHAEYKILVQDGRIAKVNQATPAPMTMTLRPPMMLVLDKLFRKKEYVLTKGSHTIGRYDNSRPSDFMIKDSYASAQSLRIDVNLVGNEFRYKMTVVKTTNPIYHNNKELGTGDIIYLDYNDTIKIGKTLIKVQKCKSK